ncbi:MAG: hypothetical protein U1F43_29125 [Myxococcota bacterium]
MARGDGSVEWWGGAPSRRLPHGVTLPPGDLRAFVRPAGLLHAGTTWTSTSPTADDRSSVFGDVSAMRTVHHHAGDSSAPLLLEILEAGRLHPRHVRAGSP